MKQLPGYPEAQLVTNRSAVLLYGASETDRHSWAEDAAAAFEEEGPLQELREPEEKTVAAALGKSRGVIYVPDALKLPLDSQRELARQLHEKEERPKWVFGLSMSPEGAVNKGLLRDDLAHALSRAKVDLADAAVKQSVKKRRAKAGKKR
jgi:hypothetical protein